MKWIYMLVFCLLIATSGIGQLSDHPASTGQSTVIQPYPASMPTDSGYIIYSYDDGIAENYTAWQLAGNMNAVKFILYAPSAVIVGAQVYVGDGMFPAGGTILNQPFLVSIYDSDGENNTPGTLIDSISTVVKNYGWVKVTGLWASVSRDYYIVITQLSNAPDCIPIGVDESQPKVNQSYSRNNVMGNPWVLSPYQDFMINAFISTNVGMEEVQISEEVKISPNPANQIVRIDIPDNIKHLSVYNAAGQAVFTKETTTQSTIFINSSFYLSGVYYIRFTSANGGSVMWKLAVVH